MCDCPEAHLQVRKVLYRFRETTRMINRATDDPDTRKRIAMTWKLQDKLVFPDQVRSPSSILERRTV